MSQPLTVEIIRQLTELRRALDRAEERIDALEIQVVHLSAGTKPTGLRKSATDVWADEIRARLGWDDETQEEEGLSTEMEKDLREALCWAFGDWMKWHLDQLAPERRSYVEPDETQEED